MSEKWKRLLCTWLAALMIISYVPMSVSAEETEQVDMSEPETASETEAAILPDLETAIQTASEETVVASGVLVSGHSWKIMSDGTLRITGSGAMPSFSQSPWIGYVNSITSIIIDPGTTSIGDYTFYELGKVKTAVIPDTVTSIGEAAFCWCEGLTSIDIPGSVRTIGEDAFWCCLDLVSVTFHEGLQTIEREAFQGCRLITELKFPESLKSIGYWAFGGCSDLVSVEIPGGVEKLDDSVFSGCTSLKTVKLHEGLISIGNSGFAYCFALDTILIPGSVQSIGETAFYQCSQLGTVTFTGNPPVIAESAFAAAVATVRYPSVNTAWSAYAGQQYGGTLTWQSYSVAGHNYANTVVAPTCTEWGYTTHRCTDELCDTYYMDSYQDALGHSWNSGVVSGGTTTFTCVRCGVKRYEYSVSGTCGSNARWTLNTQTGVLRITGTGTITVSYGRNLPWQSYISGIRHVIIEPGITGIGAEAFFECGSIETIEIPNTVKSIGMQAFVWCKSLKEVTIPEGVTSLGESTFWGCESLETLNLPSTLKSIGKKMFYRCDSLKTLVLPESVTFIDELAFWDCGGITQITVPRGVTKLSEDVFNGCSNLHTVYLPDTLTEIGPGAFSYCSKLKNITIPDSVTYLGETAFFGCSSLRNVMIPGGVTKLERGVFYGCSNMGYLYFTGEPPVFAEDAFQGLSAGIRYPSVLRSAWSQHTSQKYAGSVYWYSYSVTGHNYQNTLVAPTCENRGYTRHTCTDYGCNTYYMDTYTDALGHKWNEGSGSTTMWTYTCTVCGKTRTVYTVGGSCGAYAKWSLNTDEGVLTIYGSGTMSNFSRSSAPWGSYKDSIKKVVIRSGITSVGSYAFYEHSAIESVELPDTIRTLGEASFCWAENLRAIHIPEGVTSIPEDCFWACLSMEEISLPSTLKTIGQGAFYSNQGVTQLDLPAGLTDIGEDAFWQCYGIRSVTIPKGVTILRETVFCSCTSLKTVVLHDNITEIQRSAFNDCSSLTSMTLPKNLKSVGVNALSDIKVSSLTFHDQVEFLDSGVLYGASVKEIHFLGDVPEFDAKAFSGYTGTAYYPRYNQTWTASVRQNYGGSITWKGEGTCPHSYDPFVTPPTCYSQGYTEYICSICGDAYLDDFVDVVDHSYNLTVIPPTCTESGYTEYTCTGCGLYYVDDYVSALGHSFEQYVFNNDATCTDDGTKTAKCESCDETDTVTAAGTATGHDYKAVITESTCTEQGYTTHTCSKCGDTYKDSYAEAAGHKFGDWEIVEEPSCVEKGEERRECENCDHFETREVEATGHDYQVTVTEPTCTERGYTTHTCANCGDSYADSYVDGTGHSFSDWTITKNPTFTESGEESRECVKCSHVEFRAVELTVVTSGNFGEGSTPTDKVTYTLYSNGTMVVEGNGSIFHCDWNGTKQPFIEYRKQIKHLIIGEGITQTTGGCFAHLTNLLTVSFPSTLTKLHNNAFMSSFATSVTEITIPETVSYMGAYSIGHHSGDESAYFTDIILENPNITIADNDAVFNGGAKLNQLTLYSHGTQNNVSAYAAKYGIKYIDLDSYAHGVAGEIEYRFYDGVLTLRAESGTAIVPAGDYPWNDQRKEIQKIVIGDGIVGISDNAFVNYAVLEEVELPDNFQSLGSGAFAVTDGNSVSMSIVIPKQMKSLGENIFAGRSAVNATAYYGSIGAELNEPGVELKLKKVFKLLLIGNSYSEDASCCAQGMKDSMLFDAIQAMLGEDAEVVVGAIISGGKGINWHATQAENGNKSYYFKTMSSKDKTWKSQGSTTSADALAWTDWDAVSLQPYNINVTTGKESVPYPDSTDPKFYHIKDASSYMLDHVTRYAPYADIYFYMHWAQTSSTVLNAALNSYNKSAAFMPQVLNYEGTESGAKFKTIIPVGLSVQNARTTYLALLAYNTTAYADKNLNLKTDAQIGLQRDGGHLSFNIGRYIAGLTFAETIIPMEMRAEGYVLPDIRITESVGRLPKEYTEIAQKSVFAAVESWRNGKLAEVTEIEGYREDPTVAAAEKLAQMTVEIPCALEEALLITKIGELALAELSEDFCVDQVALPEDFEMSEEKQSFTATVTIRFGYTSKDVAVNVALENEHSYESAITAPTCTEAGYSTHTCANCGDSYVDTYVEALGHSFKDYVSNNDATCTADGTKTAKCERCDATDTITDAGTAKGHSFGDWTVTTKPTCTETGEEQRKCADCDHSENRETEAAGHNYEVTVTEPTCTEQGFTTHTCSKCGDSYKDTYVDALGHSFKDYVSDKNATCTTDGTKTAKCERCDATDAMTDAGTAKGHSFGDWTVEIEASCVDKGTERRDCANCDHFETGVIEATGHNYEAVVTEPTCTEQGYTTHTCSKCNDTYKDSYVEASGHSFGDWVVTTEPTCTEKGAEERKCANCDHSETRETEAAGHDYEVTVTEPTCIAQGYTTHSCTECGDTYKDAYVDALGHDYGEWETTKEATCEENGQEQRICGNCEAVETRILEAIGHNYEEAVTAPTCMDKGFTTHTCSNCGDKYEDSYVDALGHEFGEWTEVKDPTCTAAGEERKSCENCEHFESREVAAIGHNYEAVVTDPTCIAQGYTTHTCSNCGDSYVDSYIDALGHDYGDWETVKEATYEEDGEERRECSRCGDEQKRIIPMLTHSYESVVTAPTCTEKGYTTHTCTDCGDSYKDTYVDALGHSFKNYVSDNNATCTADGTKTAKCERCDATDTMTDAGTAKGHSFGDWTVKIEATCVDKGTERRDCENCDHFETRVIEATGHNYEAVITEPTCTEQGYTTRTCSKCGDTYKDSYVEAAGHSFGDWVVTTEPTCTEKGEERRDCENCDHFETRETEAAGHDYEVTVTEPTCTEQGYTTHTCSNCGDSYVDTYIDALGHSFKEYVSDNNATCTADGTKTAKCERCDATDTVTDAGTAKGHSFGEWIEEKAATCVDKGTEHRDCENCDHFETREVEAIGHDYKAVITEPTCIAQGYTTHTCSNCGDSYKDTYVEALGHSFKNYVSDKNATCTADGTKTAKCERCDATDTITDVGTTKGHALSDWTVVTQPTCTKKGTERRSCANCDHSESREIAATGHEYEDVVTVPTCEAKGYTTHSCIKCEESYVDSYVDAIGHDYSDWKQTKAPTCEETGEETRSCANCGNAEKRILDATGHDFEATVTAPTCEAKGYTAHTCANCGDSHVDSYVDAIGHNFEDGTCSNCGEPEVKYLPGDVDLDGDVDVDDVLALLWHVLFPDDYPIEVDADFDHNGSTDVDDVLTLLWYVLFPEDYPI